MKEASQSRSIDELLVSLGVWGKYQLIQFAITKLLAWPASNQLFSIWFLGYQPPLRCKSGAHNASVEDTFPSSNISSSNPFYPTCKELFDNTNGTNCMHGYEYDHSPSASSTTTEWDLVCGINYQATLAQTVLIGGQAFGATLFTSLADRFGRRPVCLFAQWGMLITSIAISFSPNVTVYLILRFVIGTFQQGHVTMLMVIPMEILPAGYRAMVHLVGGFVWTGSMLLFVAMGYLFQDIGWRNFQLVLTISSAIPLLLNMLFLKESIRWLYANGKDTEANKLIAQACRINKADEKDIMEKARACVKKWTAAETFITTEKEAPQNGPGVEYSLVSKDSQAKYGMLDVMRSPRLRLTAFVMFFGWINTALTTFGLHLTAHRLAGDRFLNYFLLTVVGLPLGVLSYYTMTRIGRRVTAIAFTASTGIALLATVILDTFVGASVSGLVTALTIIGSNTIGTVFGTLFQYTPELFPTNLRSIGVGIASSASRIGGMVGPFSNLLIEYYPWAPGTIYGCFSMAVCFLFMLLPETVDKELPQTIHEINMWNKNKIKTKKSAELKELETLAEKSDNTH